jgi:hypothetical protein
MHNKLEDRIAKAALGGSLAVCGVAITAFLVTGGVALDVARFTLDLSIAPAAQGLVLGALMVAGVLRLASRVASPASRWLGR